ncbi:hypothetical protein RQP46_002520 [Phenoliferia psychrophenolica]
MIARASFMTLPLELNAKVVEMVSDQEDAWRDRVEDPEGRVGHINCLSSVALVNKELRGLAAKHQFDTLVSDKAWQPVFRFAILQRFGHHITRVSFVKSDSTQFDNVLAIISQLSSLRALTFTREAAVALFGSASSLAAYAELVRSRDMDPSVLDQRHLSPFHPNAGLDYTGNKASYLKEALVRTLEFGRNEVERMFGEGNVARAVGWVAKLKALEDERLVWKD